MTTLFSDILCTQWAAVMTMLAEIREPPHLKLRERDTL